MSGLQGNRSDSGYFKQKLSFLRNIKRFLENEHEAIISTNLELLNEALRKIEDMQIKIDNLDRKNKSLKEQLTIKEKTQLKDALTTIVELSKKNEQLLTHSKESLMSELRTTHLKKRVRGVYGDQASWIGITRSVG